MEQYASLGCCETKRSNYYIRITLLRSAGLLSPDLKHFPLIPKPYTVFTNFNTLQVLEDTHVDTENFGT